MPALAQFIYNLDKAIFQWLRNLLGGTFLDEWTTLSGNWVFWVPFLAFLGVMVYSGRKKVPFLNLFFMVAAFVLAFQIAFLLAAFFLQPAPYVIENILEGTRLPAFSPEYSYNLPDWTVASFAASWHFVRRRLQETEHPLPRWTGLILLLIAFSRVLPGYAYPMDVFVGLMIGSLVGFLMHQFARSVEVVLKKPL